MKGEIIAVGTEILLGDIVNTNARYLSKKLAEMGISVYYQSVVGDNPDRLEKAIELAFSRCDLVITTGGLGPTKDDLTKEVGSSYFGRKLIRDENAVNKLKSYFKDREIPESNFKQCDMPEGCIILENNNGTAPGCIIEDNGRILICLPGPPEEMSLMSKDAFEFLKSKTKVTIFSQTLHLIGVGEAKAAEVISDLMEKDNPTVAPYAKESEVQLRITAMAENEDKAKQIIEPVKKEVYNRLGKYIYTDEDLTLEEVIVKKLKEKGLTLTTAESLTGGLLSGRLVNVSGASDVFKEGYITYCDEAKNKILSVDKEVLEKYSAVSSQCVGQMAEGAAKRANAQIGLATTGYAGPTGEKVGLAYVGLYYRGYTVTKELNLKGTRAKIRNRCVNEALVMLFNKLREEN